MGVLLSTFRKKKSSLEELEEIELAITNLEATSNNVEERYRMVARLVLYVGSFTATIVAVLAYFWPEKKFKVQFAFGAAFFILAFVVIFLKKILNWYYNRQIRNNRTQLFEVRQKKKKIIENVMEKETYKVAKEILEKYAPDRVASNALVLSPRPNLSVNFPRRNMQMAPVPTNVKPALNFKKLPVQLSAPSNALSTRLPDGALGGISAGMPSKVDRFLEFLIGDGPTNRYALICKSCHTHNGMVLKEEFPYIGFRCFECKTFNPPRMLRPTPPQLLDNLENLTQETANDYKEEANDENESSTDSNGILEDTVSDTETSNAEVEVSRSINENKRISEDIEPSAPLL